MAFYCSGCGVSLPDGVRYCSACGKAVPVANTGFAAGSVPQTQVQIVRPRFGRKIAGVCRGLANHYGWDVTWTRVIAVVLALAVFPVGFVAYALFWVLLPEELVSSQVVNNLRTTT